MAKRRLRQAGPTKKHLARLEIERRQSRLIQYITIAVVVMVVGLLAVGYFEQSGFPPQQKVAVVNGDGIPTDEFLMRVKLARVDLINTYSTIYQSAQFIGLDPTSDPRTLSQLQQIYAQLNSPEVLGQQVLDTMISELLVRQEAAKMGITVPGDEVEKFIQERFEFFPNGTPTPIPTSTPLVFPTLSPTQLALATITPTPTTFPTLTPAPTATTDPGATPTPAVSPTATFTPFPTATPLTQEGYESSFASFIDVYNREAGMDADAYRKLMETILIRNKLIETLTVDVQPTSEQVWARHILVTSEEDAKKVYDLLMAGDDFSKLAAEYSIDSSNKDNGGNLGWFGQNQMVKEFEDAAYSLAIGEISSPVESQFGWHIIQALGHENRPMNESEYEQARQAVFNEWLQKAREAAKIKTYDFWKTIVPTEPTIQ